MFDNNAALVEDTGETSNIPLLQSLVSRWRASMGAVSKPFYVSISGELACFSRPELKTERVSYPIPTPSALRGILEAILWKPAIRWEVEEIRLLKPIRYLQFRRNEVNGRMSVTAANSAARTDDPVGYYADEHRAQRNTLALRDVGYSVQARMLATARWGPEDSIRKFEEMFERRVRKGQFNTPPALGCREFFAIVELEDQAVDPLDHSEDFGLMLHDIRFGTANEPVFYRALMWRGVVTVPPFAVAPGDVR